MSSVRIAKELVPAYCDRRSVLRYSLQTFAYSEAAVARILGQKMAGQMSHGTTTMERDHLHRARVLCH